MSILHFPFTSSYLGPNISLNSQKYILCVCLCVELEVQLNTF